MTGDLIFPTAEHDKVLEALNAANTLGKETDWLGCGTSQRWADKQQREYLDIIEAGLCALQSLQPAAQVAAPAAGIVHPVPVSGEGVQGADRKDAERYRKLRRWMGSNVAEGWGRVEQLGAICAWLGYDDFDKALDTMPNCNVGLSSASPSAADQTSPNDLNPAPPVLPIEAGQQEPAKLLRDLVEAERAWNAAHPIRKVDIAERLEIERLSAWARAQAYVAAHPPAQEAAEPSANANALVHLNILHDFLKESPFSWWQWREHYGVVWDTLSAPAAPQAPAQKDAP